MKLPKISVIMSSYNHEKFVSQAIESVLNQTFQNFEFLIIDDNSTDKTFEVIGGFKDDRIMARKNNQNYGMVTNTNNLINEAKGEYIAIINSDDFWENNKLQKQLDFLDSNNNFAACFTMANIVDDEGLLITNPKHNPFKNLQLNQYELLNYFFFYGNFLCYPSVLIRKSIFKNVGLFNPAYLILLDYEMWIRICIAGYELKILDEKLTNFRKLKGEKNLSGNNEKSITILAIENKMFVKNYQKIKDYKHFIKIFPDYQDIAIDNKNLDSHYYLIDYCYKTIFKQQNIRFRNIRDFILELIHTKTREDQSFFDKMSSNLSIHYKEYSGIIKQYSYGPNLIKIRKLTKEINKLKYYFLFPLIVLFIFLLFY